MSEATAGDVVPAKRHARAGPVIAVCLAIAAIAFALLPFNGSAAVGRAGGFQFSCRPPITSAWNHGPHQLRLWAVTVGTNMQGYEVQGGQAPWCGDRARPRLALSAGLLVLAAGVAIFDSRARRRRAPTGVAIAGGKGP